VVTEHGRSDKRTPLETGSNDRQCRSTGIEAEAHVPPSPQYDLFTRIVEIPSGLPYLGQCKLEVYHKRRPKPKIIVELKEMLQSIWDGLPQSNQIKSNIFISDNRGPYEK